MVAACIGPVSCGESAFSAPADGVVEEAEDCGDAEKHKRINSELNPSSRIIISLNISH